MSEQEIINLFFQGYDIVSLARICKRQYQIEHKEARKQVETVILQYYKKKKYLKEK